MIFPSFPELKHQVLLIYKKMNRISIKFIFKKTLENFIKCRLEFEFEAVKYFRRAMCNLLKHIKNFCGESKSFFSE